MAGCRVELIDCQPPYSSQVSRGRLTGKIRSAICEVSSMKLLKLTTNRSSCSKAFFTPPLGGKLKAGLTLFNINTSTGSACRRSKNCKTSERRAAISTRCRLLKSSIFKSGSSSRFNKFTAILVCRPFKSPAPVPVPSTRGLLAPISWIMSFS